MHQENLTLLNEAIKTGNVKYLVRFPDGGTSQWVKKDAPVQFPNPKTDMILAVAIMGEGHQVTHVFVNQEVADQNPEEIQIDRESGVEVFKVESSFLTPAILGL